MSSRTADEDQQERRDRQLDQLLQELRVAMPGVQVLFAFLLAVPFIAPTAYHRLLFEQGEKERLIRRATVLSVAGLLALGIAMTGAVVLVTDFLFASTTTIVAGAAVGVLFAWLWFAMALVRRVRS